MNRRAAQLEVVPAERRPAPLDWRVERMRALCGDVLAEEWDPERLLVVPRPGGPLTRRERCGVAGCERDQHGASPLCSWHIRQFTRSGRGSVDEWLAAGEARLSGQRRMAEEGCVVTGQTGERCPRPAGGRGLCHAHGQLWADQQQTGVSFEEFLARARPMPGFGPCAAASCYLEAAYKVTRLCRVHYYMWQREGRPAGRAFDAWVARVRQPANGRVLSLRGLPELVRLELLYAIGRRVAEQIRTGPGNMRAFVDRIREAGVASVLDFDLAGFDPDGNADPARFARFVVDRVRLAYGDAETERHQDRWDLRLFGHSGHLDFSPIRQDWLRAATKTWASAVLARARSRVEVQHRVQAVAVLSRVLASGPGGGHDPAALGRADVDRFLVRVRALTSPQAGRPYSARRAAGIVEDCAFVLREARDLGLLAGLGPTFVVRRADAGRNVNEEEGRALPAHVVTQLDAHLDLLRLVPGSSGGPRHHNLGVLGEHAGEMAVLAYRLLKSTGRRVGEIASLHLGCLDVDEHGKAVLVYDNHKAGRMGRRLPLADTELVEAVRAQQRWIIERFPATPKDKLWLLPRPNKNADGSAHLAGNQIAIWIRSWVRRIPRIDAGVPDDRGDPVPYDRAAIYPHAFRHTYAQTLADEGVPPSVLRDLMDHRSMNTTLGYYRVGEEKKRRAMELLARHTIDNRGTARPIEDRPSHAGSLREQLSWVAVPMGKCAEPTNVRAGGQACPIRYQCAGCPHFETDPSYLPELRGYADDLRREREVLLAVGAADWVLDNVTRQLEVILGHVRTHEKLLDQLTADRRALVEEASATVRKARQWVPVAFRRQEPGRG